MKTIKEKAIAYDEALKVIKDNLDALNIINKTGAEIVNIQAIKNCFYRAFPELKESEGEKTLDMSYAPQGMEAVEYTRTDAFIERAIEYLHGSLEDTKVIDDYRNTLVRGIQARYTSVEEFVEDFKKYMEE